MTSSISTTKDARKFVNDTGANMPIVLTSDVAQGNFHTIESVLVWLKNNRQFNSKVIVRGTFNITASQLFDFSFLSNPVLFEGDGGTFNVKTDRGILLGSNVQFKKLNFVYNFDTTTALGNLVNNGHGLMYAAIGASETLSNVVIEDCIFSVSNATGQRYSYINIDLTDFTAIVKDIKIKNNTFKLQADPTFSSAIAIINSCSNISGTFIPKLANCEISGNICDGDQSIVLTTKEKAGVIQDAGLSCINVKVLNNNCGMIGAIITSSATGSTVEPNNSLIIEGNTCNYIANVDETGMFVEAYTIIGPLFNIVQNTGNTIIRNNKCAFIHYGVQSSPNTSTSLQIINNILTSNIVVGTIHSSDYLDHFNYPTGNKRYAIYVSADPITSWKNTVLIEGNRIGGAPAPTGYESFIRCGAAANIVNNYMEGMIDAASLGDADYSAIIVDGYTGTVKNNTITKSPAVSIYAYISTRWDQTSSDKTKVIVTDNIFDHYLTVDADPTSLLVGKDAFSNPITDAWVFKENINQTSSINIPLFDDDGYVKFNGASSYTAPIAESSSTVALLKQSDVSSYTVFTENTSNNVQREMFKYIVFDHKLPVGVKIKEVKMGIFLNTDGGGENIDFGGVDNISLKLNSYKKARIDGASPDILDIKNNLGADDNTLSTLNPSYAFDSSPTATALRAATQYLIWSIDSADEKYFITGNDASLSFYIDLQLKGVAGKVVRFYMSPVRIMFRW